MLRLHAFTESWCPFSLPQLKRTRAFTQDASVCSLLYNPTAFVYLSLINNISGSLVVLSADLDEKALWSTSIVEKGALLCSAFSTARQELVTADTEGGIKVWAFRTPGHEKRSSNPAVPKYRLPLRIKFGDRQCCTAMCLDEAKDRLFAAVVDGLRVYNMVTGEIITQLPHLCVRPIEHMVYSPSEVLVTQCSGEDSVTVWHVPGGAPQNLAVVEGNKFAVTGACIFQSEDGPSEPWGRVVTAGPANTQAAKHGEPPVKSLVNVPLNAAQSSSRGRSQGQGLHALVAVDTSRVVRIWKVQPEGVCPLSGFMLPSPTPTNFPKCSPAWRTRTYSNVSGVGESAAVESSPSRSDRLVGKVEESTAHRSFIFNSILPNGRRRLLVAEGSTLSQLEYHSSVSASKVLETEPWSYPRSLSISRCLDLAPTDVPFGAKDPSQSHVPFWATSSDDVLMLLSPSTSTLQMHSKYGHPVGLLQIPSTKRVLQVLEYPFAG
jgi:hypothetical protein